MRSKNCHTQFFANGNRDIKATGKSNSRKVAVLFDEKLDIVNVTDGARETQRQLIRKCSNDMINNRYIYDVLTDSDTNLFTICLWKKS